MHEPKVVRERRAGYGDTRRFRSSNDVYLAFKEHFNILDREHFLVLLLDAENKILGYNTVSVGSLTVSIVHPREVWKPAILENAASIILMHNHPSGDPLPSQEDLTITTRLRDTGDVMGIKVLDHIIFGSAAYTSFVDDGYWNK